MELNMRGLHTTVRAIRRRVFTEVAKLGFKADADTLLDDMESIPYEIVNDDTEKYRESTYRSRAIVRERLRLAMGLSLRPENKPVHLTAGVEASNISEKYYEPPLMQVIPSACESCEENKYEVSNVCKGCLAHPCQEVCPKGAISMVNGRSFIDQDKCIQCGACIHSCPFGAIGSRAGIVKVINAIKAGKRVVAMVAPAAEGQFGKGITMTSWRTALKKLGFADMVEVALGGDLTAQAEAAEWAEAYKEGKKMTTSCCPAFVNMVRKHFPTLSDHISTSVSPMCGVSRMLKAEDPDCITVFIGPCVAKKSEMQDQKIEGNADFVMLFSEVLPMLEARGIELEPEEYDKQQASIFGKHFAHSHGVTDAVVQSLKETGESTDIKVEVCNGAAECKKALMLMKAGRLKADFIEGMACPGGCVGGPGARMPIPMFKKNREECLSKTEDITIEDSIKKHVGETLKFSMHRS